MRLKGCSEVLYDYQGVAYRRLLTDGPMLYLRWDGERWCQLEGWYPDAGPIDVGALASALKKAFPPQKVYELAYRDTPAFNVVMA